MNFPEILDNAAVIDALNSNAPISHFSGNQLAVTYHLPDKFNLKSVRLTYDNWRDASDWWYGANDCIYARQIRQEITADEIEIAAIQAGLDRDAVVLAMLDYRAEVAAAEKKSSAFWQKHDAQAEAERLEKVAAYEQAAPDEKREMLYNHEVADRQLYGRYNRHRRGSLRKRLAKETPPATFNFYRIFKIARDIECLSCGARSYERAIQIAQDVACGLITFEAARAAAVE